MNREEFIRGYWNYYLSLEKRALQTESYVEFHLMILNIVGI